MNAQEILSKWLEYTEYDENQKSFNLLSSNYYFHRTTEKMKKIMQFDQTGTLAVLFAKQAFIDICKEARISYFDLFSNPGTHDGDKEMWDVLVASDETRAVEEGLLDRIDTIVQKVVPAKMLGERDKEKEREVLFKSISSVVEELVGCHENLFLRGGEIRPIEYFSTHIHVFDKLSNCLLAMESCAVRDGLYLCFIKNGDSADCYFTFMLKSNGNLLSINERVNEKYPGQHNNSRNGRWSESKKYNLFPYNYIIDASDFDYKGYSHKQVIDEEKLAFFNLSADAYMPLILGMVCIATKYAGMSTESMKLMLVDSLLPWNLALPSPASEALMVPVGSKVGANHARYAPELTSEAVLSGELGVKYHWSNIKEEDRLFAPHGSFEEHNEENIFVKLYGDGFTLRKEELLVTDPHLRLTDGKPCDDTTPNNEYIASADWMDMIAYQQARVQLAEYLRDRIFEEYLAFGGKEATEKWFREALQSRRDFFIDLCVQKYLSVKQGDENNCYNRDWYSTCGDLRFLAFGEDKAFIERGFGGSVIHPFNANELDKRGLEKYGLYLCLNTNAKCSIEFVFRPWDWKELEQLFGELPKPLMGWVKQGHSVDGNPILDVTDAVTGVGTVYEADEQKRNRRFSSGGWAEWGSPDDSDKYPRPQTAFDFAISFSKRGWAQELKKRGVDPTIIKAPMSEN